jgi:hypothetical protein
MNVYVDVGGVRVRRGYLLAGVIAATVFALLLSVVGGLSLTKALSRTKWPTTTATILAATVEAGRHYGSASVRLSYQYVVDDRHYRGTYVHDEPNDVPFTNSEAEKIIRTQYAIGKHVTVYYDPAHPETAFLEPRPTWPELIVLLIDLIVFAGGSYYSCRLLTPGRHRSAQADTQPETGKERSVRKQDLPVRRTSRKLVLAALQIEAENPREALRLYRQAKQTNQGISVPIFIVSFTAPVLASILALYIYRRSGLLGTILSVIILIYVGFGVPGLLAVWREYKTMRIRELFDDEQPKRASRFLWINVVLAGPILMFASSAESVGSVRLR